MKGEEKVASPAPSVSWTRPDPYIGALARKRSFRRAREDKPRSQPAAPEPWLSTIPFAAVLAMLALIAVAVMLMAFPGSQPGYKPKKAAAHEQGVAPRGWFQEAQKEMRR